MSLHEALGNKCADISVGLAGRVIGFLRTYPTGAGKAAASLRIDRSLAHEGPWAVR
jgi:hypothetical protein